MREVEFARALRLGQSTLEPVAFHVPRVKVGGRRGWLCFGRGTGGRVPPERPFSPQKEYFQDDLYPPTRVWWEPALGAGAWLDGQDGQQRRASLRPADMVPGGCRDPRPSGMAGGALVNGVEPSRPVVTPLSQ